MNSLVSEFRGYEEEPRLEDVHGGGHGSCVEVLELDLCHLEGGEEGFWYIIRKIQIYRDQLKGRP